MNRIKTINNNNDNNVFIPRKTNDIGFLLHLNDRPSWPGIVQIFKEILVDFDIGT